MRCGHSWAAKSAKFGSGWRWSATAGASWPGCWATAARPRPGHGPATARCLWAQLPAHRRGPRCWYFTDLWERYAGVLPRWQHRRSPKGSGGNSIVKAINCSLRQRCDVLVCKFYSFSKSSVMHTAQIKIVIDNYNITLN